MVCNVQYSYKLLEDVYIHIHLNPRKQFQWFYARTLKDLQNQPNKEDVEFIGVDRALLLLTIIRGPRDDQLPDIFGNSVPIGNFKKWY